MKEYPSIETVFVRDKATNRLKFGELRNNVNEAIPLWSVSEKIDGTNIRVIVTLGGVEVRGRTDNAQLHPHLVESVKALFYHKRLVEYFADYRGKDLPPEWLVTFYGEGYGAGIQKGAGYCADKRFRCFDIMLGENLLVDDEEMRRICTELGIPTVPFLGFIADLPRTKNSLLEIIPHSVVSFEDSGVADYQAEGIVAKPMHVLFDSRMNRVVWKLTFREFK